MRGIKNDKNKRGLFRRTRKHRLQSITILPSLVTILNGICGFFSINYASRGEFSMAGFMIIIAMIADSIDGRLARMSNGTSSFGGQLDSLCDTISFGVAPAFMMLKIMEFEFELKSTFLLDSGFFQRFIWLASLSYMSCSVIRLARFNVENDEGEFAHMSFMGLPTPAGAGVVVSLLLFHQKYSLDFPALSVLLYAMPFIALGTGILMVSRIRYPHILNQYFKGKKPFGYLIKVLLLLLFLFSLKVEGTLVLIFCGFAFSSLGKWLYFRSGVLNHLHGWQYKNQKDSTDQIESHPELH
ncbi:MAG: CDP-diacylglycerol--serine O-phosphatidyltransferase [Sedimentisphaerales bacterium]|nr:CDP-diacylglycerol--serine O-phosphatidyltransferase [Sedimentisphaerales bacterium]